MRNPLQLFSAAVALCRDNMPVIAGVLLIGLMPSMLLQVFPLSAAPERAGGMFGILILVALVMSVLLAITMLRVFQGRDTAVVSAYRASLPFFWRYVGLTAVSTLTIVVGFVFFVIPGMLLLVALMFAVPILVLENKTIMESLRRSRMYVRGRWWVIFARLAPLILAGSVVEFGLAFMFPNMETPAAFIVYSLWSFVATPIAFAYWYELYKDARATAVLE